MDQIQNKLVSIKSSENHNNFKTLVNNGISAAIDFANIVAHNFHTIIINTFKLKLLKKNLFYGDLVTEPELRFVS